MYFNLTNYVFYRGVLC